MLISTYIGILCRDGGMFNLTTDETLLKAYQKFERFKLGQQKIKILSHADD